ncbi:para-aminobenzoate synthase [Oxalicibacterium flavum]|uniref:Para-aminobenzoate synthase n=1 Tax=Oxalicibacterium flavum TaxID=179467 RepID=A0A8J2UKR9_9BURK|nr:aminodeoxychorismate synthase component I [Oxalicibacterium flavum]GGC06445.1 para-aminobenzoate synthase [Oxalicibacterium flavum]
MSSFESSPSCFVLLDDCTADSTARQTHLRQSRLYTQHVGTLRCMRSEDLPAFLHALQEALRAGRFAVMAADYELGAAMHGIAARDASSTQALAQVLLFARCERLTRDEVDAWLRGQEEQEAAQARPAGIVRVEGNIDRAAFDDAMARIHAYIEAGDTYQVNYTYRLRFDAYGSLPALYARLRARQPVPYGALIALPDGGAILSLSPELFMRHEQGRLTVQPMKGTAPASGDAARDTDVAQVLASDVKNRAENLMIVDLLRNDLGRIAEIGSVQVDRLFEVQRFSSVLQMTSTVHAQLRGGTTLADIFAALYPCGSISGAPKRRTMQIIRELEPQARGIYTGAIGWFDPPADVSAPFGDFCLSVPIRTLQLEAEGEGGRKGVRHGEMGIGAGIVHDSVAADEYAECLLKARFLTGLSCDFRLFETMRATARQVPLLERHLRRLHDSAVFFGFVFDVERLRAELATWCTALPDDGEHRVRLALAQDGAVELTGAPLLPLALPVGLLLAEETTAADDIFLRHKTTARAVYDRAWRTAEAAGAFDRLFFNERGELTEGGRSSVFVRLDGRWFTPPLQAGLLPGVMRAAVLDDPAWQAAERVLTRDDLRRAEEIMVCNALRGTLPAVLMAEGDA